jgi:hypothetical protein
MAYGSFQNMVAGSAPDVVPTIGMGATLISWTDRHPYTVVEVVGPDHVVVQEDSYTRTDHNSMSECQSYDFAPNPGGARYHVTRRKNGRWVARGESMKNGTKFVIGSRDKYHDFGF